MSEMFTPRLDVACRISYEGRWWELNEGVYRLAEGSFEDSAVTLRRREAPNEFLEGTFVIDAVRENVTETLAVWVESGSRFELREALERLKAAVRQPRFQVVRTLGNEQVLWNCYASDHSVQTTRAMLHAGRALFRAQLLRDPVELDAEVV